MGSIVVMALFNSDPPESYEYEFGTKIEAIDFMKEAWFEFPDVQFIVNPPLEDCAYCDKKASENCARCKQPLCPLHQEHISRWVSRQRYYKQSDILCPSCVRKGVLVNIVISLIMLAIAITTVWGLTFYLK